VTLLQIVRDALARIVRAEEALEDGERRLAWELLRDLEEDVAVALRAWEERWAP
jgi:hypothetical protein